ALASELRAGRLDLDEVSSEIGPSELAQLAELWRHLVEREADAPSDALLELAPLLAGHGFAGPVRDALTHPSARLRAACLKALAGADASDTKLWRAGLHDPDPLVRLAALRAMPAARLAAPEVAGALRERLGDPDREVRAEAARWLGGAGAATLAAMLQSSDREDALAGLHAFDGDGAADGASLVSSMASRVADPDPRLRAAAPAALPCGAPHAPPPAPPESRLGGARAPLRRPAGPR